MTVFHSDKHKKAVTFAECISITREYEYDKTEDEYLKKGKDWQRTTDLTCREFNRPISKGGCGGNWSILEGKLGQLEEPQWCMIGQLWSRLHPNLKRAEEESDTDSDSYSDTDSDTDTDNDYDSV